VFSKFQTKAKFTKVFSVTYTFVFVSIIIDYRHSANELSTNCLYSLHCVNYKVRQKAVLVAMRLVGLYV